ncbi:MAG: NAD(P)H-hydrate dehydratase [Myxococcota bacterium]
MSVSLTRLAWPLPTSAQMRALDRHTIETLGVPGPTLMESAGRAVAEAALALREEGEVVVVCGGGNNGGDGLVAARHLHLEGVPVRVALLADAKNLSADAAPQLERARAVGIAVEGADWQPPAPGGVLVDAVFGTGLARDVEGEPARSIERMRAAHEDGVTVIAVDLPSGLCADTGRVRGVAVEADLTVALGLPKLGLALEPGRSHAGGVRVARIGIVDEAPGVSIDTSLWTAAGAAAHLPERPAEGHKGTFGHALIVAGSQGKTGAAALAAEAALRIGAGLVTIGCPAGVNDILEVKCTEAMTVPLPDTPGRALAAAAESTIVSLASTRAAVGLGPGIGREEETLLLVRAVAKAIECPLALDADALVAFADDRALLASRSAPTVLTPHPGEAGVLLGVSAAEVNADRPAAARELAASTGAVVLLKGAATLTADPSGLIVNPTGGPILGSGGTGDVLLGLVTGLLTQGLPARDAAALAAWIHGATADGFAATLGDAGLLASEQAAAVPGTVARLRSGEAVEDATGLVAAFPDA